MVSRISRILVVLCIGGVLAACSSASYVRTDKQPPGSASRSSSTAPATSSISGPSYRVAKGDTMYGIAFRNGLDFRDLARWNNIESPYTIYVGQMLRLGPASGSMASTPSTAPPRQASPSVAPSTTGSSSTAAKPQPGTAPPANTSAAAVTPPAPVVQAAPVASNGSVSFRWPVEGPLLGRYAGGDPARAGIDIGAKAEVFRTMRDLAAQGLGILFVTSDLDEVLALSDRILVMANGRISGDFPAGTEAATVIAAATPTFQKDQAA